MSDASTHLTGLPDGEPRHVLVPSGTADDRTRVLKHGDTFAVFDHMGHFQAGGLGEEGLYHDGTRYLSCLRLELDDRAPFFLGSTVRDENDQLSVTLTNPDRIRDGRVTVPLGALYLGVRTLLWDGACHWRLRIRNHGTAAANGSIQIRFQADFADIFEVRGMKRPARGSDLPPELAPGRVVLGYKGLDGQTRRSLLRFVPAPPVLYADRARFDFAIGPHEEVAFDLAIACWRGDSTFEPPTFDLALTAAHAAIERYKSRYGSVDATPLFVLLAGAYYERTADLPFAAKIWPHVEAALLWIDRDGDRDRDGFIEYERRSENGLIHQGWKDSDLAICHADGTPAAGPIALCEVQSYVYAARRAGALLASALELPGRAATLESQAGELRAQFESAFWCDDLETYALALDGDKKPCRLRASNAGHCLFAGIASPERAARMVRGLMSPDFFSGWGIRTLARTEVPFNPMSYHNGSVWPHDNAVIAYGASRYGPKDLAELVLTGLFAASNYFELNRMPELFCGFDRETGEGPVPYPVACAPQAWAAGSVFLLLQACLGLRIDAVERQVSFHQPQLPTFVPELRITNLEVGPATLDIHLVRHGNDVGVDILGRTGQVSVVVAK